MIEWTDTPPEAPRTYVRWKTIVAQLQTRPGSWAKVAEGVHVEAVRDAAKQYPIETRVADVDGKYAGAVYARYIPENETPMEWSNE